MRHVSEGLRQRHCKQELHSFVSRVIIELFNPPLEKIKQNNLEKIADTVNLLCAHFERTLSTEIVEQLKAIGEYWEKMDDDMEMQMQILRDKQYELSKPVPESGK